MTTAISFLAQAFIAVFLWFILGRAGVGWSKRIASAVAPLAIYPLLFLFRMITVPAAMSAEAAAKLVPLPSDGTPLFRLSYCAMEQREGSRRAAVAEIEYVKDIRVGQLRVWGYEHGNHRTIIEAHDGVNQMKHHKHKITLATVAIFDRSVPIRWGTNGDSFGENDPKIVVIEMTEGKVRQEVRIELTAMLTGDQCHLKVLAPDWNPYFWPDLWRDS